MKLTKRDRKYQLKFQHASSRLFWRSSNLFVITWNSFSLSLQVKKFLNGYNETRELLIIPTSWSCFILRSWTAISSETLLRVLFRFDIFNRKQFPCASKAFYLLYHQAAWAFHTIQQFSYQTLNSPMTIVEDFILILNRWMNERHRGLPHLSKRKIWRGFCLLLLWKRQICDLWTRTTAVILIASSSWDIRNIKARYVQCTYSRVNFKWSTSD